jgi:hypothetical protein
MLGSSDTGQGASDTSKPLAPHGNQKPCSLLDPCKWKVACEMAHSRAESSLHDFLLHQGGETKTYLTRIHLLHSSVNHPT